MSFRQEQGSLPRSIVNMLTVDVEDYFHVSAFEAVSPPETWASRELRVERSTDRLLSVLDEGGLMATFFILGWVAERCSSLVRRIVAGGHEVASHGQGHQRVCQMERQAFREDVRRSKALLEDLAGDRVVGYRAPSYSISQVCLWAFDELYEAGYVYDSSVFPIRHDLYGMPFWPRFPFVIERLEGQGEGNWVPSEPQDASRPGNWALGGRGGHGARGFETSNSQRATLLEVPVTTLKILGKSLPIAGGGYFRFYPYGFTRWGLRRINRVDGKPFVFYLHPWEFDPEQPLMEGAGLKSRFRHYVNLRRTEPRFRQIVKDFSFAPIRKVLGSELSDQEIAARSVMGHVNA